MQVWCIIASMSIRSHWRQHRQCGAPCSHMNGRNRRKNRAYWRYADTCSPHHASHQIRSDHASHHITSHHVTSHHDCRVCVTCFMSLLVCCALVVGVQLDGSRSSLCTARICVHTCHSIHHRASSPAALCSFLLLADRYQVETAIQAAVSCVQQHIADTELDTSAATCTELSNGVACTTTCCTHVHQHPATHTMRHHTMQ